MSGKSAFPGMFFLKIKTSLWHIKLNDLWFRKV